MRTPACYRAPGWPDPEFSRKIPKNTPWPEILDSRNLPRKYRKNTPKIPKIIVLVFFRYGYFLGVPKFRPGAYFFGILVEIPGRAISGLCSRQGHSQDEARGAEPSLAIQRCVPLGSGTASHNHNHNFPQRRNASDVASIPLGTLGLHFIIFFQGIISRNYFILAYIKILWPNYFS